MGFFRKKAPDIDDLKTKRDVKGLVKALWWNWKDNKGDHGIDELYRRKAAQSLSEIADSHAIESLVNVISDAEHKQYILKKNSNALDNSVIAEELSIISQLAKESLSQIGQPAVEPIFKFLQQWKLDLKDSSKWAYYDSAKKSLLEVLINIGDSKTIFENLHRAKENMLPNTYSSVSKSLFSELSTSMEGILTLARMAAEAIKTNDLDSLIVLRSVLKTRGNLERFSDVLRSHYPSLHRQILEILQKDDNITTNIEGIKDMNENCIHCGSLIYKPKTMVDRINFDAMQRARVGCSNCGVVVCFSCAATSANERGKTGNCCCPKCGTELGRGGEAGEIGEHFSKWN
jgi:hypothetical protein